MRIPRPPGLLSQRVSSQGPSQGTTHPQKAPPTPPSPHLPPAQPVLTNQAPTHPPPTPKAPPNGAAPPPPARPARVDQPRARAVALHALSQHGRVFHGVPLGGLGGGGVWFWGGCLLDRGHGRVLRGVSGEFWGGRIVLFGRAYLPCVLGGGWGFCLGGGGHNGGLKGWWGRRVHQHAPTPSPPDRSAKTAPCKREACFTLSTTPSPPQQREPTRPGRPPRSRR